METCRGQTPRLDVGVNDTVEELQTHIKQNTEFLGSIRIYASQAARLKAPDAFRNATPDEFALLIVKLVATPFGTYSPEAA